MKIIILLNQNLTPTNFKRFNVSYKDNFLKKEFWSILGLYNLSIFNKYNDKGYRVIKHRKFINFISYLNLYKKLKKIKKGTLFLNQAYGFNSLLIEITLKFKGCIKLGKLPYYNLLDGEKISNFDKLKILRKFGLLFIIHKISLFIKKKIKVKVLNLFSTKTNYYLIESQQQLEKFKKKSKKNFFMINSTNFCRYYNSEKKKINNNYFVFLDSEIENTFESQLLENKNFLNKEKYWNCMDNIFNNLQSKFRESEIKIAAHHRRNFNNRPIARKFYFDKTLELVKNSKLVITHHSQAIEWAILFNKPILLINLEIFDSASSRISREIEIFHKKLSAKILRVDLNYNYQLKRNFFNNFFKINKRKYEKFKNYYLNFNKNNFLFENQWQTISRNFKDL